MKIIPLIMLILVLTFSTFGAKWRGKSIDGKLFDAEIFSYGQAKFYDVQVKFRGTDCYIYWPKGGYIMVDLDDEDIDDIHNISAFNYKTATYYDIDVAGLD